MMDSVTQEALPGVKTIRVEGKGILQRDRERESMHSNLFMTRAPHTNLLLP